MMSARCSPNDFDNTSVRGPLSKLTRVDVLIWIRNMHNYAVSMVLVLCRNSLKALGILENIRLDVASNFRVERQVFWWIRREIRS